LHEELDDKAVRARLESAVLDDGPRPSVETFMHAYLLKIPEVNWVIHTHPNALIPLLCQSDAKTWATWRLFPDHVVCCGIADCFVPYIDPGLALAKAIKTATEEYAYAHGRPPKCYWLANHGLITLGRTSLEAESATMMAVTLTKEQIERIATRPDEHFRQAQLWLP
jgi:rhamnose utilization protein RhaD (predicted bifunctional aldolase and dehydrogenase)